MTQLTTIPPEILDRIFSSVPSPNDLLSVALSSKFLLDLVIPRQLYYRRISCEILRPKLWETLASKQSISFGCYKLYIIPRISLFKEKDRCLPPSLDFPEDLPGKEINPKDRERSVECTSALASAIRNMPHLDHFIWDEAGIKPGKQLLAAIFETCSNLTELELSIWGGFLEIDLSSLRSWRLSRLARFSYRARCTDPTTSENQIKILSAVLNALPLLEDVYLNIDFPDADPDGILREARWPKLRRFSVCESLLTESYPRFFEFHGELEALNVEHEIGTTIVDDFRFSHMPKLRQLQSTYIPSLEQFEMDINRNLTHLDITPDLGDEMWRLEGLLEDCLSLTTLVLHLMTHDQKGLIKALKCVPQIRCLQLDWLDVTEIESRQREDLQEILAQLPNLTEFRSVVSIISPIECHCLRVSCGVPDGSNEPLDTRVLPVIVQWFPSVTHMEVDFGGQRRFYLVCRSPEQPVCYQEVQSKWPPWCDFYSGSLRAF